MGPAMPAMMAGMSFTSLAISARASAVPKAVAHAEPTASMRPAMRPVMMMKARRESLSVLPYTDPSP
jgi:hypothetical protein